MSHNMDNHQIDARLGIQTHQLIEQEFGDHFWHYHRTESTDYYVLDHLFREFKFSATDQLVDMGSGTGRVLIYSAYKLEIPVVGVEFIPAAFDIAQRNILAFNEKMGQQYPITILNQPVEEYQISSRDTVFYFFNPFQLVIMRPVIYGIMQSVVDFPRKITLIYYYPLDSCIQLIEEKTDFQLKKTILLPGNQQDPREKIVIYQNNL